MVFISDEREWAESMFGDCNLGDPRRTNRLVDLVGRQAADPKGSVNAVCGNDSAAAEAAYRFLRNERVVSTEIDEGPFRLAAKACSERETILAIQDTTMLGYTHSASKELGTIGGTGRGFVVHSTLAVDADTREVIGLLDQERWSRKNKRKRSKRNKAPYKEKEGYKWEASQRRTTKRLVSTENVINICDREAESNEYLQYQKESQGRFIVRARIDRRLVRFTRKRCCSDPTGVFAWT